MHTYDAVYACLLRTRHVYSSCWSPHGPPGRGTVGLHKYYRLHTASQDLANDHRLPATVTFGNHSPSDWLPHQEYALFPPVIGSRRP
eukprot:9146561-Pyramimonas_sp.AAC.1